MYLADTEFIAYMNHYHFLPANHLGLAAATLRQYPSDFSSARQLLQPGKPDAELGIMLSVPFAFS